MITGLFSYVHLVAMPWRLSIAWHLLDRRSSAPGRDFYGRRTEAIWFHIPTRPRVMIISLLWASTVMHFATQACRFVWYSYELSNTLPGTVPTNATFGLAIVFGCWAGIKQGQEEKKLRKQTPARYPPDIQSHVLGMLKRKELSILQLLTCQLKAVLESHAESHDAWFEKVQRQKLPPELRSQPDLLRDANTEAIRSSQEQSEAQSDLLRDAKADDVQAARERPAGMPLREQLPPVISRATRSHLASAAAHDELLSKLPPTSTASTAFAADELLSKLRELRALRHADGSLPPPHLTTVDGGLSIGAARGSFQCPPQPSTSVDGGLSIGAARGSFHCPPQPSTSGAAAAEPGALVGMPPARALELQPLTSAPPLPLLHMPPQLKRPAVLDGLSDADDGGNGGGGDGDGSGARAAAKATATTASDEVSAKAADPPQLDPPPSPPPPAVPQPPAASAAALAAARESLEMRREAAAAAKRDWDAEKLLRRILGSFSALLGRCEASRVTRLQS